MPNKYTELLNPQNCTVILIDHQPQMAFGVASIDRQTLINNTVLLAKTAKIFHIPAVLTSVETESFSGYLWPQILDVFPGQEVIERSSMNSWEDPKFVQAVKATGRKKLVFAALWTEVCLNFPVLEAMRDGFDVYFVTDASGGTSKESHDMAVQRMIQAGATPITALQFILEIQRDWSRKETYNDVIATVKEHCGAYGVGVEYAYTMVHKQPQSAKKPHNVPKKAH
jgi:nicotinamidase-related amidase